MAAESSVYPGTLHRWWLYVPAGYDDFDSTADCNLMQYGSVVGYDVDVLYIYYGATSPEARDAARGAGPSHLLAGEPRPRF